MASSLRASPGSSTPVPRPVTSSGGRPVRAAHRALEAVVLPIPMISPRPTRPTPASSSLIKTLRSIPTGAQVRVDLSVDHLDHAAYEAIEDWRRGHVARGGSVEVNRMAVRAALRSTPARRLLPWQSQVIAEPDQRASMLDGIRAFEESADQIRPMLAKLAADGQRPTQLFITCADSRIVPNMITTTGPGDQFCVRNIGNLVPPHGSDSNSVEAAIEYAVDVLGVRSLVVCGHSHCGAAAATLEANVPAGTGLQNWLRHFEPSVRRAVAMPDIVDPATGAQLSPTDKLSVANVGVQLANLRTFACVRRAEEEGRLELIGLWFDISAAAARLVLDREPYLVRADEELAAASRPFAQLTLSPGAALGWHRGSVSRQQSPEPQKCCRQRDPRPGIRPGSSAPGSWCCRGRSPDRASTRALL